MRHLRSQAVAYVALFVALGGTSYAAIALPAGSVHTRQLHNGAVTNSKLARHAISPANLNPKSIAGYVRAFAQIGPQGQLVASRPSARLAYWTTTGRTPGGEIVWSRAMPASCFALANATATGPDPAYVSALFSTGGRSASTFVELSADQGPTSGPGTINVAVMCPQP